MMAGHPRDVAHRARKTIDRLHDGWAQLPDRAAETLTRLLDVPDDMLAWRHGEMVNLLGSEDYVQAFAEGIKGRMHGLPVSEKTQDLLSHGRAMALGTGSLGGFAVPFQLDPSVILTSAGAVDPVRRLCRSEVGTAKEYDLVTSAGVVASYVAEGTEAGDNSPTLAQPKLVPNRMQAFVPFSIELSVTWGNIINELTGLLTDAAGILDAQAHITGSGVAPNPQGIVTGMAGTANEILTATTATLTLADLYKVQAQVPPRFRPKSQWIANLQIIQAAQQMQVITGVSAVQGSAQSVGDIGRSGGPVPGGLELLGDDLSEASFMNGTVATGNQIAVCGDFYSYSAYCIYDVLPSLVEPIPHLFGPNLRPVGQRGLYLWRFSGAQVVNPSALAQLKVK